MCYVGKCDQVAMRVHVDTCVSSDKSPDSEIAGRPVPHAKEKDMICVVALEWITGMVL